jgi:hypothetical protein
VERKTQSNEQWRWSVELLLAEGALRKAKSLHDELELSAVILLRRSGVKGQRRTRKPSSKAVIAEKHEFEVVLGICSDVNKSVLINHRDVVGAEQVIESAGQQPLDVLACYGLHHPKASLEIGIEVSPDMHLSLAARSYRATLDLRLRC